MYLCCDGAAESSLGTHLGVLNLGFIIHVTTCGRSLTLTRPRCFSHAGFWFLWKRGESYQPILVFHASV